jgi:hypothetical protein
MVSDIATALPGVLAAPIVLVIVIICRRIRRLMITIDL